MIGGT